MTKPCGGKLSIAFGGILFACVIGLTASLPAKAGDVLTEFEPCAGDWLPENLTGRALCASLTAPEDRDLPEGRSISLPVMKIPAEQSIGAPPVYILNGGPGDPNLATIRPFWTVNETHDVIYLGYRGAEGSVVLDCPELTVAIEQPDLFSKSQQAALGNAASRCAKRLEESGIDLSQYTMLNVIEDIESARKALGHDKIHLFSLSYGTRLAQYYSRLHPERVSRSAMWGANPPGHFVFSTYVNDKVLRRHSELCASHARCAAKFKNLHRTMIAALHAGEGQGGEGAIDDARTRMALFASFYARDLFAQFSEAALAAEKGDYSALKAYGDATIEGMKGIVWGDILSKGASDMHRYDAFLPTLEARGDSMGSPFDLLYRAIGQGWPSTTLPDQFNSAVLDFTDTLVMNGDIDTATPVIFAEAELMPYLPNGRLIILKDYGHSDYHRQYEVLDHLLAEYYITGRIGQTHFQEDPYSFGD